MWWTCSVLTSRKADSKVSAPVLFCSTMTVGGKRESNICMTEEIRQREKSRRKIIRLSQKDFMSQENNWISQRSLQEGVKVMELFGGRWEEKNKMDHPFIF